MPWGNQGSIWAEFGLNYAALTRGVQGAVGQLNTLDSRVTGSTKAMEDSVTKALGKLGKDLAVISGKQAILGEGFDSNAAQARALESALGSLLNTGIGPADERVMELARKLKMVQGEMQATAQAAVSPTKAIDDAISATLKKLSSDLQLVAGKQQVFGAAFDANAAEAQALERAINQLLAGGLGPADQRVAELSNRLKTLQTEMQAAAQVAGSPAQAIEAAVGQTFEKLNRDLQVAANKQAVFGASFDANAAQARALEGAINSLLSSGLEPTDARVTELANKLRLVNTEIEATGRGTERATNQFHEMAEGAEHAGHQMHEMGSRFEHLGMRLQMAGMGLSMTLTAPFTLMARSAIQAETAFDTAMRNVWTLTNQTKQQLEGVSREVEAMSRRIPQSADMLAEGLYQVISAAIPAEKAMGVLEVSAKAASAGLADSFSAVDAITSVLNAYGMQAEEAGRVSDIMFRTVDRGKVTFPEMAQNIGDVVSTAAVAGVSFEELGAAIATLTKVGVRAPEAVTAINQALLTFVSPSEEAIELSKKLGIEFSASAIQSKGLVTALDEVYQATGGNIEVLSTLFPNVRALKGILGMTRQEMGLYSDDLAAMKNSTGATERAFAKQVDSMANQWQFFKNASAEAMRSFAQVTLPTGLAVVNGFVKPIIEGFGKMPTPVKAAIVVFGGLAATAGPLLVIAGSLVTAWGAVGPVFLKLIGIISGSGGLIGFLTGPVGIAIAIGVVVAAIASWVRASRDVEGRMRAQAQAAQETVSKLRSQADEYGNQAKSLAGLLDKYGELEKKAGSSKDAQAELNDVVKQIGEIAPSVVSQWNDVGEAITINAGKARDTVKDMLETRKALLEVAQARAKFEIPELKQMIKRDEPRVNAELAKLSEADERVKNLEKRLAQAQALEAKWNKATTNAGKAQLQAEAIRLGVVDKKYEGTQFSIPGVVTTLEMMLKQAREKLGSVGENADKLVSEYYDAKKRLIELEAQSKELDAVNKALSKDLWAGVSKSIPGAGATGKKTTLAAVEPPDLSEFEKWTPKVKDLGQKAYGALQDAWDDIAKGLKSQDPMVKSWAEQRASDLLGVINKAIAQFGPEWEKAAAAASVEVKSGYQNLKEKAQKGQSELEEALKNFRARVTIEGLDIPKQIAGLEAIKAAHKNAGKELQEVDTQLATLREELRAGNVKSAIEEYQFYADLYKFDAQNHVDYLNRLLADKRLNDDERKNLSQQLQLWEQKETDNQAAYRKQVEAEWNTYYLESGKKSKADLLRETLKANQAELAAKKSTIEKARQAGEDATLAQTVAAEQAANAAELLEARVENDRIALNKQLREDDEEALDFKVKMGAITTQEQIAQIRAWLDANETANQELMHWWELMPETRNALALQAYDLQTQLDERTAALKSRLYMDDLQRQGKAREAAIAEEEKRYKTELETAKGNSELLADVEKGHTDRLKAINDEYDQQRTDAEKKVQADIFALTHSRLETVLKDLGDQEQAELDAAEKTGQDKLAIQQKYSLLRAQVEKKAADEALQRRLSLDAQLYEAQGKLEQAELAREDARHADYMAQEDLTQDQIDKAISLHQLNRANIQKKYADERKKIEQEAHEALLDLSRTALEKELALLDRKLEEEKEKARKAGADTTEIEKLYEGLKQQAREKATTEQQILLTNLNAQLLRSRREFEAAEVEERKAQWLSERDRNKGNLEALKLVDETYQNDIAEIHKRYANERVKIDTDTRNRLAALSQSALDQEITRLNEEEKAKVAEAEKAGADVEAVHKLYDALRIKAREEAAAKELVIKTKLDADLLRSQGDAEAAELKSREAQYLEERRQYLGNAEQLKQIETTYRNDIASIRKRHADERLKLTQTAQTEYLQVVARGLQGELDVLKIERQQKIEGIDPKVRETEEGRQAILLINATYDEKERQARDRWAKTEKTLTLQFQGEIQEAQGQHLQALLSREELQWQAELDQAGENQALRELADKAHWARLGEINNDAAEQRRKVEKDTQEAILDLSRTALEKEIAELNRREENAIKAAEKEGASVQAVRDLYAGLRRRAEEEAAANQAILMAQVATDRLKAEGKAEEAELKAREAQYLRDREQHKGNADVLKQLKETYELDVLNIQKKYADERVKVEKDAADKLALAQQSGLQAQLTALRQQRDNELADPNVKGNEKAEADTRERYGIEEQRLTDKWNKAAEIQQLQLQATLLDAQGQYEQAALKQEEARWKQQLAGENLTAEAIKTINKTHELYVQNIKKEFADKRFAIEEKYRQAVAALGMTARQRELEDIKAAEKAEIDEAKKAQADTTNITKYYERLREQVKRKYDVQEQANMADMHAELLELQGKSLEAKIERENTAWEKIRNDKDFSQAELERAEELHNKRLAKINNDAAEERLAIEKDYRDRLADLSLTKEEQELASLERQKETAVKSAQEKGAKTADIEAYYDQLMKQARKKYADERLRIEEKYFQATAALTMTARQKELADIDQAEKEELKKATEAQANTASIVEYYRQLRIQVNKKYDDQEKANLADMHAELLELQGKSLEAKIERENAAWEKIKNDTNVSQAEKELAEELHVAKLAQINDDATKERLAIERDYSDRLSDLSRSREEQEIASLERQKEAAVKSAQEKGAATGVIEAYWDRVIEQTRKKHLDERAEYMREWHDKVLGLTQSALEAELLRLDREKDAALKQAREKLTIETEYEKASADIQKFYDAQKEKARQEDAKRQYGVYLDVREAVARLREDEEELYSIQQDREALAQDAAGWDSAQRWAWQEASDAKKRRDVAEAEFQLKKKLGLLSLRDQISHEQAITDKSQWSAEKRAGAAQAYYDSLMGLIKDAETEELEAIKKTLQAQLEKYKAMGEAGEAYVLALEAALKEIDKIENRGTWQRAWDMAQPFLRGFADELDNLGDSSSRFFASMIRSIRLVEDEGSGLIDWTRSLNTSLKELASQGLALVGKSLARLFSGGRAYRVEGEGFGAYGKVNYTDFGEKLKNYYEWEKNLKKLKEAQQAVDTYTVGGGIIGGILGFLFGGPIGALLGGGLGALTGNAAGHAQYDEQIEELQEKLKDTFQSIAEALGTAIGDLAGLLGRAFDEDTYDDFVDNFSNALFNQTKQALVKAFMAGEIMRPLLQGLSDAVTFALLDAQVTADEKAGIQDKMQAVVDAAKPFYEALKEIFPETYEEQGGAGAGGGGSRGTQISEITGPTRDLLLNTLRPLSALDSLPTYASSIEQAIHDMRDAFLAFVGVDRAVEAGTAAVVNRYYIENMTVNASINSKSDFDQLMASLGKRAELAAVGSGG